MKKARYSLSGVLAATVLLVGMIVGAPSAGATAGDLCSARAGGAPFWSTVGGSWVYTVPAGGGIRDDGGVQIHNGVTYHWGHGNGHSSAWFRLDDSTCH
ncbi:hypothetical protein [Amycolatopsis sp. lyj-112]|uniref:hypothetical protein n=1 Tax=Amycolatopsis sp. lyj-112 TaxID=2789288 RepID=UPI003978BF42